MNDKNWYKIKLYFINAVQMSNIRQKQKITENKINKHNLQLYFFNTCRLLSISLCYCFSLNIYLPFFSFLSFLCFESLWLEVAQKNYFHSNFLIKKKKKLLLVYRGVLYITRFRYVEHEHTNRIRTNNFRRTLESRWWYQLNQYSEYSYCKPH